MEVSAMEVSVVEESKVKYNSLESKREIPQYQRAIPIR